MISFFSLKASLSIWLLFVNLSSFFLCFYRTKLYVQYLFFLFPVVIFSFRLPSVGIDSVMYYDYMYNGLERDDFEYFFKLLMKVLSLSSYGFFVFSFLNSFLVLCSSYKLVEFFFKDSRFLSFYFLVLTSSFYFLNLSLSIMRQSIAVSIFLFALLFFLKRRFFAYFFLVALATLFHSSAIFLFALPLVYYIRLLTLVAWVVAIFIVIKVVGVYKFVTIFVHFLYESGLASKRLLDYFSWQYSVGWEFKHFYFLLILMNVYVLFVSVNRIGATFIYKASLVGWLFLGVFSFDEMVADRIFYYFIPINIIVFTMIFREFGAMMRVSVLFGIFVWSFKTYHYQLSAWFGGVL
ncbi:EpsG family protein [Oceanisphaera marina]|uniref:EpsG family protein n=1 Tax=Oceanisphaera marina TaxID=2017550 RepID=UPI00166B553E|nr:EpsG family protein [Oceanisphaera marina]